MKPYTGPRPTLGRPPAPRTLATAMLRALRAPPFACAVAVIRWGPEASSDKLRQAARCTACGHKGARLQAPSWAGNVVGVVSGVGLANSAILKAEEMIGCAQGE
jgi:hypothetical protein